MIKAKLDRVLSPIFIILFLIAVTLKLTLYPNTLWVIVGSPLFLPPLISLGFALYQRNQINKEIQRELRAYKRYSSTDEFFRDLGI